MESVILSMSAALASISPCSSSPMLVLVVELALLMKASLCVRRALWSGSTSSLRRLERELKDVEDEDLDIIPDDASLLEVALC